MVLALAVEQVNQLMQGFAALLAHQQQNYQMLQHVVQSVGTPQRARERGSKRVLMKEDLMGITEFRGEVWEHWSSMFRCDIKNISTANYELFVRSDAATREVSLKETPLGGEMELEEVERVPPIRIARPPTRTCLFIA